MSNSTVMLFPPFSLIMMIRMTPGAVLLDMDQSKHIFAFLKCHIVGAILLLVSHVVN
jgi:hypothetical protein